MSLWDDIVDAFKPKKKKEEEEKRRAEIEKKESELMERLAEIDRDYTERNKEITPDWDKLIPKDIKLEYKEYEGLSDDEIKDKAERSLEDYYSSAKDNIDSDYNKSADKKATDVEKLKLDTLSKSKDIEDAYAKKKKNVRNNSVRNGIMTSSIAELMEEELGEYENDEKRRLYEDAGMKLKRYEDDIKKLEEERDDALKNLDLTYATKLEKSIDTLKKEREKEMSDVIAYNNKVKESAAKYKTDRLNKIARLEKKISDKKERDLQNEMYYGYEGDKKKEYESRYKLAHSFYDTLTKKEALESINNNWALKQYLGKYYNTLLLDIGDRKE